jgi:octaprenyl-diphosphate synthase
VIPAPMESKRIPTQKELFGRLGDDLERFHAELRERLRSDVFLIDQGVRYLVKVRGKALRPFVVLASARLFDQPTDLTYRAAMIVELLHTATLIHDDVVDKAETRRAWPTFNRIWGNKYSVLFGDYLLAHSLIATLEKGNLQVVHLLADTARQMSQGQLNELARSRRSDMTRELYLSMITDKTASLFRTSAALGALTLNRPQEEVNVLSDYGKNLGIAFQIRDDVLDYVGHQRLLGKSAGADVLDKKITLPLLCALERCEDSQCKLILKQLRGIDHNHQHQASILQFVRERGGVESAQTEAERFADRAITAIHSFKHFEFYSVLSDLAIFAARRSK